MISTLIVSHGGLATELLSSARKIAGEMPEIAALSLDWDSDPERVNAQIRDEVHRLDHGEGVLILVDVFGGTPCNEAVRLLCSEREARGENCGVEVVTGVNLPMVLRIGCLTNREIELHDAATWLSGKGQSSIRVAGPNGSAQNGPKPTKATAPCG